MIKFFRKYRQQLLSENRFTKYLIYAIGEIILVVIGILIALQINNWNETQKQNKEEYKHRHFLYQRRGCWGHERQWLRVPAELAAAITDERNGGEVAQPSAGEEEGAERGEKQVRAAIGITKHEHCHHQHHDTTYLPRCCDGGLSGRFRSNMDA